MTNLDRENWYEANASISDILKIDKNDRCALVVKGNLSANSAPALPKKSRNLAEVVNRRKPYMAKVGFPSAEGGRSSSVHA